MGITVALNILEHLPSLSFFQMAKGCDILLLRDDFYYKHHFYHNRMRIATKSGAKWVEVAVVVPEYKTPINQIKTGGNWKEVYRKKVMKAYSNHLHFNTQMPLIHKILDLHSIKLGDYNYYFMKQIVKWLHLPYEVKRITGTPDTDIADHGFKIEDVLHHYNTESLIVCPREYRYIKLKDNINITCIIPEIIQYPQKGQAQFIDNVSIIDALMNLGIKATRKLIV